MPCVRILLVGHLQLVAGYRTAIVYWLTQKRNDFYFSRDKGRLTFFPAAFFVLFLYFFQVLGFLQLFIIKSYKAAVFFKIQDH